MMIETVMDRALVMGSSFGVLAASSAASSIIDIPELLNIGIGGAVGLVALRLLYVQSRDHREDIRAQEEKHEKRLQDLLSAWDRSSATYREDMKSMFARIVELTEKQSSAISKLTDIEERIN